MTLPAHPPPLKDESMASWLSRLASANGTSIQYLLSAYLREVSWERVDLDMLEKNDTYVLAKASNFRDVLLRRMVLSDFKETFLLTGKHNRKTWLSSTFVIRYCPICLQEDNAPYHRVFWRLHFVPICLIHGCLIQSIERKYAIRPNELLVSYPKDCDRVFTFASSIRRVIDKQEVPNIDGFPYSVKEFLGTLMLFMLYFSKYLPQEKEWNDLKHLYYASPCGFSYLWRTDSNFACIVIEKALMLLEAWPKTENFILQNKANLKRLYNGLEEPPRFMKRLWGSKPAM